MKYFLLSLFFIFTISVNSQFSRYPYIQSTTTNSTIIAWRTSNGVLGVIKYGTDPNNLIFTKTESTTDTIHALLLDNLIENTKYYYAVYSGLDLETEEYFYTAKDSTHNEFSFLQYGDCGYNSAIQHQIGNLMEADSAEFAVVCGDIDQGGLPHFNAGTGGDDYDEIYFDVYNDGDSSKMLSRECHYTAIGNHDYYANNGAEYENSFYLPHNNSENSEKYYSFTWGDAKFICLDVITPYDTTYNFLPPVYNTLPIEERWWTDFRAGTPQYEFLEDELRCNDKKWVFVYFHEGPWTNYWGADYSVWPSLGGDYYEYDGNIMVRDELVPLFEQYNVDFVLNGHSHLYERGEKDGVTYVTSGSAGESDPIGANTQYATHPEILVSLLDNIYTKINVYNDSVSIKAINKEDTIVDSFNKTKSYIAFNTNTSITNATCNGGNDGSVTLNIVGPKPPYSIEWFDGDTLEIKDSLSAGTHFAYVRDGFGCEKIISITIEEPPVIIPQIISTSGNDQFCEGETISLLTINNYSAYSWSTGETTTQITLTSPETVSVNIITDEGCLGTSAPFSVNFLPKPTGSFNYANSGTSFNFLASGNNIDEYIWDFGDGSDTTLNTNLVNHVFENNSSYIVQLIVSNECDTAIYSLNIIVGAITPGIIEVVNTENIEIYPNPFDDKTKISTKNLKGILSVKIYNNIGNEVLNFKTKKKVFFIEKQNLSKGIYYIEIVDKKNYKSVSKLYIK